MEIMVLQGTPKPLVSLGLGLMGAFSNLIRPNKYKLGVEKILFLPHFNKEIVG